MSIFSTGHPVSKCSGVSISSSHSLHNASSLPRSSLPLWTNSDLFRPSPGTCRGQNCQFQYGYNTSLQKTEKSEWYKVEEELEDNEHSFPRQGAKKV
jgi:hypothetical protein